MTRRIRPPTTLSWALMELAWNSIGLTSPPQWTPGGTRRLAALKTAYRMRPDARFVPPSLRHLWNGGR